MKIIKRDWFLFALGLAFCIAFCLMGFMFSYFAIIFEKDLGHHAVSSTLVALGVWIFVLLNNMSIKSEKKEVCK